MKTTAILLCLILLSIFSCKKNENLVNTDKLAITYGHVCGWCAGFDSITVSQASTTIFYDFNCGDSVINRSIATNQTQWSDLKQNFDPDKFQKILLNTCNVCVDGCDTWITVKSDSYYHMIRYGYSDLDKLKSIQSFINVLDSIRNSITP